MNAELLQAVRMQRFGGVPGEAFPSLDLAVVCWKPGQPVRHGNVLFSREHPQGVAAEIGADLGPVRNIRFNADQRDARGDSVAWLPGANWGRLYWRPLWGEGPHRFVAPYPASLLKLLVAVGVGLAVDAGRTGWPDALEPMITVSDNDATDACVALLHRTSLISTLNERLQALKLPTLQLNGTTPRGGWRNGDGAGVGQIHMTAWDTVRLLWLLEADAPQPPWLAPGTQLLQPATRERLLAVLRRQELNEILSSGSLRSVPGWVRGLPDSPAFAHKTGTTENYASDAGIVRTADTHYAIALLTSLGSRHAPHPGCATVWQVPALGAAVHELMRR